MASNFLREEQRLLIYFSLCFSSNQMGSSWITEGIRSWFYRWILGPNDLPQESLWQEAKALLFQSSSPQLQWSSCSRLFLKTGTSLLMFDIKLHMVYIFYHTNYLIIVSSLGFDIHSSAKRMGSFSFFQKIILSFRKDALFFQITVFKYFHIYKYFYFCRIFVR